MSAENDDLPLAGDSSGRRPARRTYTTTGTGWLHIVAPAAMLVVGIAIASSSRQGWFIAVWLVIVCAILASSLFRTAYRATVEEDELVVWSPARTRRIALAAIVEIDASWRGSTIKLCWRDATGRTRKVWLATPMDGLAELVVRIRAASPRADISGI